MVSEDKNRKCPYCKEEIKSDAIVCKHCRSRITPENPTHGGTCPFCKESINPEAIKCKHCGSYVGPREGCADCEEPERSIQPQYHLKKMPITKRGPSDNFGHKIESPIKGLSYLAMRRNPFIGPFSIFGCQSVCDYSYDRCSEGCGGPLGDPYCIVDCLRGLRKCQDYCDFRELYADW